jgi:hypothetical protein
MFNKSKLIFGITLIILSIIGALILLQIFTNVDFWSWFIDEINLKFSK